MLHRLGLITDPLYHLEEMTEYDEIYEHTANLFGEAPENVLVDYGALIEDGGSVLDVGCGQGRHTLWLARKGFDVVGLDPSATALEIVGDAAVANHLKIKTVRGSFRDLDRPGTPFSAICIFGLLQILNPDDVENLLRAIERWTKPGSLLFLTAWTVDDPRFALISTTWPKIGANSYRHEDGRIRTFLEKSGVLDLFPGWKPLHHWEGLGPWHQHGESPREQHANVEFVAQRLK